MLSSFSEALGKPGSPPLCQVGEACMSCRALRRSWCGISAWLLGRACWRSKTRSVWLQLCACCERSCGNELLSCKVQSCLASILQLQQAERTREKLRSDPVPQLAHCYCWLTVIWGWGWGHNMYRVGHICAVVRALAHGGSWQFCGGFAWRITWSAAFS